MFASLLTCTRFRPLFLFCSVCLLGVAHLVKPLRGNAGFLISFPAFHIVWSCFSQKFSN